ncbi:helix-turn-helix domain-containing protein [Nocardioides dubius]|uniref:PucR family transcriptional regulator n=1 Tax=Nocardioides dubius TaxID=317019 RepID=A0ABN1TTF0_9ACTN
MTSRSTSGLRLPDPVVAAIRAELPGAAERCIAAVMREVPQYSEPFRGRMGRNIENAVTLALGGFLDMATTDAGIEPGSMVESVFEAAYALGRGEARSGRTMDALAAAYRVGGRAAWHDLSASAVENGLPAAEVAKFAEFVFDYIDQLSAASVSGHADELATSGRVRERHRERLAHSILTGVDRASLTVLAERADWAPPATLTAVIAPSSASAVLRSQQEARTLHAGSDAPGLDDHPDLTVLLIPDLGDRARTALVAQLADRQAVVGPTRPWDQARTSYRRALRAIILDVARPGASADSEDHLVPLVLTADRAALADLRERVLAPMQGLRPTTIEKLTETLRAWVLHQGRRDEIATVLFVHPQSIRYRVGRLRELYGDRLTDPQFILEAAVALGLSEG